MITISNDKFIIALFNKSWIKCNNLIYNKSSKISSHKAENIISIDISNLCVRVSSDVISSIPLFYTISNGVFILSDDANYLLRYIYEPSISFSELANYFGLKYTQGPSTVLKEINQVLAGEEIIFNFSSGEIDHIDKYFFRCFEQKIKVNLNIENEYIKGAYDVFLKMFNELNGRPIVIPLSGGLDSRFIAVMVKIFGLEKNTIALSYGPRKNNDSELSKKIAKKLNIEWVFIEYNEKKLQESLMSERFKNYLLFAFNLSRVPLIQDYFAIEELYETKKIDKSSVFIPGHTGDFLAGDYLSRYKGGLLNSVIIMDCIRLKQPPFLDENILRYFCALAQKIKTNEIDYLEIYNWRERHAKFIINMIRSIEYFGFCWRVPLWDIFFFNYWSLIPNEMRLKRKLCIELWDKYYFKKFDVGLDRYPREQVFHPSPIRLALNKLFPHLYNKIKEIAYSKNLIAYPESRHPLFPGIRRKIIEKNDYIFKKLNKYGYFVPGNEINAIIADYTFQLFMEHIEKRDQKRFKDWLNGKDLEHAN
jgi:asparagine synthase (glutamine-hydrolysing)